MSKDVNKVGTITSDITTETDIYEKKREKLGKVFFILFIILLSVFAGMVFMSLMLNVYFDLEPQESGATQFNKVFIPLFIVGMCGCGVSIIPLVLSVQLDYLG